MPTFDNSATKLGFGVDTLTTDAFTIGSGDDRYGAACLSTLGDPGAITVAEMGGVAGEAVPDAVGADASWNHTVYKFPSPPSGDQTVTFTWTNARSAVVSALTVTGASDVDGGAYAQAASGTVSVDIASNDGDLTASFSGDGNTGTDHATNQTIRISGALIGADTGPGTAGPISHTWTHAGAFASNAVGINFVQVVPTPTPTPVIPTEQPSGGYGYYNLLELARIRREARRRLEKKRKEDEDEIQAALDRQVAQLLYEQEQKDAEKADLARIQALADRLMVEKTDLPRPILASVMKANEERTRNSLLQLERMISQMLEEEEAMVAAFLLMDD